MAIPTLRYRVRRNWWRTSCRLYALGLSVTYSVLYLFAAICLATGVFHPDISRYAPHHHGGHAHHYHAAPDAHCPTTLPDICDFALQALTTSEWRLTPTLPFVLWQGEVLTSVAHTLMHSASAAPLSIRAPPEYALRLV